MVQGAVIVLFASGFQDDDCRHLWMVPNRWVSRIAGTGTLEGIFLAGWFESSTNLVWKCPNGTI
jgi:hypothetical protein